MTNNRDSLGMNELDLNDLNSFQLDIDIPLDDADKIFEQKARVSTDNMSAVEMRELIELATKIEEARKHSGISKWFVEGSLFDINNLHKHRAFFEAGKGYKQRYFSAGNRCGKTVAGAFETACHMTGLYPHWWNGKRFTHPVDVWVAGESSLSTRNIQQKELIGEVGSFGTGMIPKDLIIKTSAKPGVPNAIETVLVRHVPTGGISTCGFMSYEQGMKGFYGTAKHVVWPDELPPIEIYNEMYMRTLTTKGILYVTATPLAGLTPFVLNFYTKGDFLPLGSDIPGVVKLAKEDQEQKEKRARATGELQDKLKLDDPAHKKAVILAGWDDAPWLDANEKAAALAECPPNLVQARSKGLPSMGSGSVYPLAIEDIVCQDFPIPKHYKKIFGQDVGWNFTSAVFVAVDPDTDTAYMYAEYKRGQCEPIIHAAAIKAKAGGDWVPGMIDPASRGRNQVDGKQLYNLYRQQGLRLIIADNAVEAGIYAVWERLACGKLKIFRSCMEFQKEYITYQRDDRGRIVKENDHCLHPDTLVHTIDGKKKIKDLVGTRQLVLTVGGGYAPCENIRMTAKDQEMVEVTFDDRTSLLCTPDHKILTDCGWVEAQASRGYLALNAEKQRTMFGGIEMLNEKKGGAWAPVDKNRKHAASEILDVKPAKNSDVYCLEVPSTNCFSVNNGVVVHNCLDAIRYATMGLKNARCTPVEKTNALGLNGGIGSAKRYF